MRFDKLIGLYVLEDISDGLGGHVEVEKFVMSRYANVEELSLETTVKIYGEAITQNVKAIVLGDIKEKIDKIELIILSIKLFHKEKLKIKTSFSLEVDND